MMRSLFYTFWSWVGFGLKSRISSTKENYHFCFFSVWSPLLCLMYSLLLGFLVNPQDLSYASYVSFRISPVGWLVFSFFWGGALFITFFYTLFFFKFYFIFKLYSIVLVLPNIEMNPPQWFSHPVCFALSNLLVSMAITFLHQAIIVSPKSSLPWSQTVSFSLVLSPQIITENLI